MTTIENVALPPAAEKPKRGRKPKVATPAPKQNGAAALLRAIEYVGMSQKPVGPKYNTHCILNAQWAVSASESITVGCRIEDEISACPNTHILLQALRKCGEHVSINQLDNNTLAIHSGKFKANIPCIELQDLPIPDADAPTLQINDSIKECLNLLAWVPKEGDTKAYAASILIQSSTCVATDGIVLLECWHGIDLGNVQLMIPKAAAIAISKIDRQLDRIGYSESSVTFWFTDGSFLKSQLFTGAYPQYHQVFDSGNAMFPYEVPKDFYDAVAAVEDFCDGNFIYFCGDRVQSNSNSEKGASYEIVGLPQDMAFNVEYLKSIKPHFETVTFQNDLDLKKVFFMKGNVRGVLMGGRW